MGSIFLSFTYIYQITTPFASDCMPTACCSTTARNTRCGCCSGSVSLSFITTISDGPHIICKQLGPDGVPLDDGEKHEVGSVSWYYQSCRYVQMHQILYERCLGRGMPGEGRGRHAEQQLRAEAWRLLAAGEPAARTMAAGTR